MSNKVKQKRRLRKAIIKRQRQVKRDYMARLWRDFFVRKGILKDMLKG
jgi:hypothetical protein